MVVPAIEEVTEPVAEAEEEQVIAPVVDIAEGQMDAPLMDMDEDLATLFGDDDFEDDASDKFGEEEVGGSSTAVAEGMSFPYPAPGLPVPPFVIDDLKVAAGVTIGELGPRVYAVEGQVQVIVSQMAHAADRWEQVSAQVEQGQQTAAQRDETIAKLTQQVQALQIDVQQRDTQIQQLQITVTKMGSRDSTLMRCILGLERRIAALERRPSGPQ
ncbi:hypothetical protein Tco_0292222 [Tanacetum coccineum]